MHPTLEFPIRPRDNGPLVRWPPPALKNFIANLLAHPSSPLIPVISWFYGTPFVLLWMKVRLQSLWTGKPMLQSIAPTDDVAQALTDKKHGHHQYINVNGIRLHYVEKGEPSPHSPLVIFLHGFPEFWYSWRNQLHHLGTHGFHCIALDMRGYGWSGKPQDVPSYDIENLIEDVRAIITALGYAPSDTHTHTKKHTPTPTDTSTPTKAHTRTPTPIPSPANNYQRHPPLGTPPKDTDTEADTETDTDTDTHTGAIIISHDWGGNVAWHAAHMLGPRYVKGVCVCNCPHPKAFFEQGSLAQFLRSWYFYFFQTRWLRLPEVMMSDGGWYAVAASFKSKRMGVQLPNATMSKTDVEVMRHAFSQKGVVTAAINYYRANMFRRKSQKLEEALMRPLTMPVLVLWGEKDEALGQELLLGMDEYIQRLKITKIPGASHWVQVDAWEDVNEAVLAFVREVRDGTFVGEDGGGGGGGKRMEGGGRGASKL